jgi:phosphatidylethanolamine-binding protein (PEBP) family uncharacterized protein
MATAIAAGCIALAVLTKLHEFAVALLGRVVVLVLVVACASTPLPPPSSAASVTSTVVTTPTNQVVAPTLVALPSPSIPPDGTTKLPGPNYTFESSAFPTVGNRRIPARYTCDGADRSPPLNWMMESFDTGAPVAYAIIVTEGEANHAVLWLVAGIPGSVTSLPAGAGDPSAPNGLLQGYNDFGTVGYVGPCPYPGRSHRYEFSLVGFHATPSLSQHPTEAELRAAGAASGTANVSFSAFYGR